MAAKWKCPDCGALNNDTQDKKICFECKTEILSNDKLEYVEDNTSETSADDEGEIVEEVVEGWWICPKCESKNRGAKQGCSACGAVRDENVEFFCDDDAPVITDEKELEAAMAGPDWICEFCGNTSPASSKNCTGCGSSREAGKKRKEKEEVFSEKKAPDAVPKKAAPKPAKTFPLGCSIAIGAVALLFMILMAFSCSEKETKIQITAASWYRAVETERYQTCTESAWKSSVPAGAKVISSSREIRSYHKVPDGTEMVDKTYTEKIKTGTKKVKVGRVNKGNGRFVNKYKMKPVYKTVTKHKKVRQTRYKKVPDYDMKVRYTIDKWKADKTLELSGKDNSPKWPEIKTPVHTPAMIGDIRQKGRKEKYTVTVKRLGKTEAIVVKKLRGKEITSDQFLKLKIGSEWKAIVSGLGDIRDIILNPKKKK